VGNRGAVEACDDEKVRVAFSLVLEATEGCQRLVRYRCSHFLEMVRISTDSVAIRIQSTQRVIVCGDDGAIERQETIPCIRRYVGAVDAKASVANLAVGPISSLNFALSFPV